MHAFPWEPGIGYKATINHQIAAARRKFSEILETPQVSSAVRPWPSLSLSSSFSGPKPHPFFTPSGHHPPPGSHTHYQSPLMASN